MNRDEAQALLPIIKAFLRNPMLLADPTKYRIKPEPIVRWAVVDGDTVVSCHDSKLMAECSTRRKGEKVIKLVEEVAP